MKIERSKIITHRGLEPDQPNFWSEGSLEAFTDQLNRGFGGIEFDANFTKDDQIIVAHDTRLSRLTDGADTREFASSVNASEVANFRLPRGRIPLFHEVMELIRATPGAKTNALHLKGRFQDQKHLNILVTALNDARELLPQIIIFDVKPETARIIKQALPWSRLAVSVAHPYDIERYGNVVGNTLLSMEEALHLAKLGIIEGVWLDEWDLADRDGGKKIFYNSEVFARLRSASLHVYLVTPELHGTSPRLHGGESHPDASSKERLYERIKEIIRLQPDAICTDHPEEVLQIEA